MKQLIAIGVLVITILAGCTSDHLNIHAGESAEPIELYVLTAASLTEAMETIALDYEAVHPEVEIVLSSGSSGSLQRQIEQGAPADVFVSASLSQMEALDDSGLLLNGYKNLLSNAIVLAVPKGTSAVCGFDDLHDEDLMFAMGEPDSVPAGRYAKEVLSHLEMEETVVPKMIKGKNVTELMTWLEAGEMDGALVYATDAKGSDKVDIAAWAPEDSHSPIIYPCAALSEADEPEEALRFRAFCRKTQQHRFLNLMASNCIKNSR